MSTPLIVNVAYYPATQMYILLSYEGKRKTTFFNKARNPPAHIS